MTHIGLLSDTHGLLDKRVFEHFNTCDEIWHAGDIGSAQVLQQLREFRPTRAVFGNMDGGDVRCTLDELYRFRVEQVNVLMTHIGGYPGRYNPWLIPLLNKDKEAHRLQKDYPNKIHLFVCGHSHILKVQYDREYDFLTLNPGAAGKQGWHTVQTLLRFAIDGKEIKDMEVIELDRK